MLLKEILIAATLAVLVSGGEMECPTTEVAAHMWATWKTNMCHRTLIEQLRISMDDCTDKLTTLGECIEETLAECPCLNGEMSSEIRVLLQELFDQQIRRATIFCPEVDTLMNLMDQPILELVNCELARSIEVCSEEFLAIFRENSVDSRLCQAYNVMIVCVADVARRSCPDIDEDTIANQVQFCQHMNIYCPMEPGGVSSASWPPSCPMSMTDVPMWARWKSKMCLMEVIADLRENDDNCQVLVSDNLQACVDQTLTDCPCYNNEMSDEIRVMVRELFNVQVDHYLAMFCSVGEPLMEQVDPPSLGFCDLGNEVQGCCDEYISVSGENPVDMQLCNIYNDRIMCIAETTKRVCVDIEESDIIYRATLRQHVNIYCGGDETGGNRGDHSAESTWMDDVETCPSSLIRIPQWIMWKIHPCLREFIEQLRGDQGVDHCHEKVRDLRACIEEKTEKCRSGLQELMETFLQEILTHRVEKTSAMFCSDGNSTAYMDSPLFEIDGCDMSGQNTQMCRQKFQDMFRNDRLDEKLCGEYNDMVNCFADIVRNTCEVIPANIITSHSDFLQRVNMFCPGDVGVRLNDSPDSGGSKVSLGLPMCAVLAVFTFG